MLQQIIVLLLFVCALVYVGKGIYRVFCPQNVHCAKGCASCPASKLKVENIEK